jgi:hypothetical protein
LKKVRFDAESHDVSRKHNCFAAGRGYGSHARPSYGHIFLRKARSKQRARLSILPCHRALLLD